MNVFIDKGNSSYLKKKKLQTLFLCPLPFTVLCIVDNCLLFSLADLGHRNKAVLSDWLVSRAAMTCHRLVAEFVPKMYG